MNYDSNYDEIFTLEEVIQSLRRIRNNKSPGFDSIINYFLKNSPKNVLKLVVALFNIILHTGRVPTQWCIGIILPLYKNKGSHYDLNNYRGITLLSCLGKLFTNIFSNRLAQYLEYTSILGEERVGFRAGYSTFDHMFVLHCLVDIYRYHNKRVFCAFLSNIRKHLILLTGQASG